MTLSQGGAAFSHTIDLSARLDPHLLPVKFTHLPPSLLSFTAGNSATPGFGGTVGCLRSLRSDPLAVSLYIYEPPVEKRFLWRHNFLSYSEIQIKLRERETNA